MGRLVEMNGMAKGPLKSLCGETFQLPETQSGKTLGTGVLNESFPLYSHFSNNCKLWIFPSLSELVTVVTRTNEAAESPPSRHKQQPQNGFNTAFNIFSQVYVVVECVIQANSI